MTFFVNRLDGHHIRQASLQIVCNSESKIYGQHSNPAVVLIVPKDVNNRLDTDDEFPMFSRVWFNLARSLSRFGAVLV